MSALTGLVVVAMEQAVAAPTCTARLADGGARVIKLERAGGETARHYDAAVNGTSAYFAWLNRGKESIVVDVKADSDRALVERMLARADVFVQNLAPGAAARLGLDAASLCARFPSIIAVDIYGYGQDTDARAMRAYDMLVQAESGICAVTGTPDQMAKVGVSIADVATGMNAHALILESLIERERTGTGRAIGVAMFDCMADWMSVPILHFEHAKRVTPRCGLAHASIFPYGAFACVDGEIMIAIQSPAEWARLCSGVLNLPELQGDLRFATNPSRVANRDALTEVIEAWTRVRHREDVISVLDANDIAWGRVSDVQTVASHVALRRIEAQVAGNSFTLPAPAGRDVAALPQHVPGLDEHGPPLRAEFAV